LYACIAGDAVVAAEGEGDPFDEEGGGDTVEVFGAAGDDGVLAPRVTRLGGAGGQQKGGDGVGEIVLVFEFDDLHDGTGGWGCGALVVRALNDLGRIEAETGLFDDVVGNVDDGLLAAVVLGEGDGAGGGIDGCELGEGALVGTAELVDGLVVVADRAEVGSARDARWGERFEHGDLRGVYVLELINDEAAVLIAEDGGGGGVRLDELDGEGDEVAVGEPAAGSAGVGEEGREAGDVDESFEVGGLGNLLVGALVD